ncbi:unnamed protein product [Ambrosiozyma monospora]|uniref:Mediator of RNA polymerase II transcription subunit 8 n=1 Tax=Ambrosiozyma monospora TaxID=43982 RepID=A0A9W7DGA6_AMBMO|nr:unnamed protein product [Ambrosiozyma monospora]
MSNQETNNSRQSSQQPQQHVPAPPPRQPAQLTFQDIPVGALEKLRPSLNQLTHSLRAFNDSFISTPVPPPSASLPLSGSSSFNNKTNTGTSTSNGNRSDMRVDLPNYNNLQNQFNVILSQLESLVRTLDASRSVLQSTNVFPNYEFNTTQFEGLLTTLLRKKHLPEVDAWIDESVAITTATTSAGGEDGADGGKMSEQAKEQARSNANRVVNADDEFSQECFQIV